MNLLYIYKYINIYMTIFNRSVYQYLCENTEKKIFYDKMIKLCYFNPYVKTEKKIIIF
jgi:hypothetical protein